MPGIRISQNKDFKWDNCVSVNHFTKVVNSTSFSEKLLAVWRYVSNIQELSPGHEYCKKSNKYKERICFCLWMQSQ